MENKTAAQRYWSSAAQAIMPDDLTTNERMEKMHDLNHLRTPELQKAAWDRSPELRAEFGNDFSIFSAYCTESEDVRIKVLGGNNGR